MHAVLVSDRASEGPGMTDPIERLWCKRVATDLHSLIRWLWYRTTAAGCHTIFGITSELCVHNLWYHTQRQARHTIVAITPQRLVCPCLAWRGRVICYQAVSPSLYRAPATSWSCQQLHEANDHQLVCGTSMRHDCTVQYHLHPAADDRRRCKLGEGALD